MPVTSNQIISAILTSINTALIKTDLQNDERASLINQYEQTTEMVREGYQFSEADIYDLPAQISALADEALANSIVNIQSQVDAEIQTLQDWKNGFEDKMYKTYDIYKEFEKVTIHTQAQVEADNTLSNEAVFNMQGFQDAKVINFILVVNVEGSANIVQTTSIDIFRYSVGSSNKWLHKIVSNETIEGRNWLDNYKDMNIVPVDEIISHGMGTFKIVNTGDKYLEIFAIGIKLQK